MGKTVAHQRPLQLGEITGNDYVVRSGLKAGDQVIVSGGRASLTALPSRLNSSAS